MPLYQLAQEPAKLSDSIKANSYCRVAFNLGNGKDMMDVSTSFSLTMEERNYLDWSDVGHAIISMKGRVHVPLHVRFPRVEVKKRFVDDDVLRRHN